MWNYADDPEEHEPLPRPFPFDAAANPRINADVAQWFVRRPQGDIGNSWSSAWPWSLAWMTQGKFDQYVECDLVSLSELDRWNIYLYTVFSGNSGSITPGVYNEPGVPRGNYGFYGMGIGDITTVSFIYAVFGANPSYTVGGGRGQRGIDYMFLPVTTSQGRVRRNADPDRGRNVPGLPAHYRFESRWTGTSWEFQGFRNGVLLGQASDDRLVQGMPGMGCTMYYLDTTADPQNLAQIDNFKAGWLK